MKPNPGRSKTAPLQYRQGTCIRDVIAFPKTQKGQNLMAQSPTPATAKQLKELHIATVIPVVDKPSEKPAS